MNSSILSKLLLTLITVFALVLAGSTSYQYWQQKDLIHSVLSEQLHDKASNYFDSLKHDDADWHHGTKRDATPKSISTRWH